ncbi:hypothetical protein [Methylophilus medardicus]|uniref:DUF11 domain-containing protein n=1 Tax=Methylophilus medardicus TaxID=2588534 RepID=A0A5B8CTN5_9PROT|nr:hypothetical protein [Methylophilus medardicus]QDC44265.1 hypothetical protein FIU01_06840 [Methylophilus medardicus]QDC49272.1 hypothetical protein FIU00_06840 [Methylophilus medardicus]QDC52977.1 hypothetical protein FIT99_06840 [Methylophilus medardicus]
MKFQQATLKLKLGLVALGLALGLSQQSAWAAGTLSGTNIDNKATLSFSAGGAPQTPIESSPSGNSTPGTGNGTVTTFKVDNKVNLTVIESNGTFTAVVPGQPKAVTTFTVTNNGNTVQDFGISATNDSGTVFTQADTYNTSSCSAFVESGATADYQVAQDTAIFIDELAPDATKTVYAVCDMPATPTTTPNQAAVRMTATTNAGGTAGTQGAPLTASTGPNGTNTVEIVFADPSTTANSTGTDPGQIASDGQAFALDAYRLVPAVLNVTKTMATICDPVNGTSNPKNIPGGYVQYAITVANTGTVDTQLTQLLDVLPTGLSFDPKLISGTGSPAATACSASGTSLSTTGFGAVTGTGTGGGYTAPGVTGQATTNGATASGSNITINYATLAGSGLSGWNGTLAAGNYITVYFNVIIQ